MIISVNTCTCDDRMFWQFLARLNNIIIFMWEKTSTNRYKCKLAGTTSWSIDRLIHKKLAQHTTLYLYM